MCIKKIIIAAFLASTMLFAAASLAISKTVISVPVANIHSIPDENAPLSTQAIYGSKAEVIQNDHGWSLITTDDDYQGWTKSSNLGTMHVDNDASIVKVKNLLAYVYQEPETTQHLPLVMLPYGVTLPVLKVVGERWLRVQLANGRSGWIQQGDVALNPKPLTMKEMLAESHKFIGLPYLWGGTSTLGFDCSGWVQFLYRTMGIILPRDTSIQVTWPRLIEVSKQNLKPGDILYITVEQGKISHEAVYLGNNLITHSTAFRNPSVQIGDLRFPRWRDGLVTVRRLDPNWDKVPEFKGSIEPIPEAIQQQMQQYTWHQGCPVPIENLSYVTVSYFGFDNKVHQGSLIIDSQLAKEVLNIFQELYQQKFPIEKIHPIEEYEGDDSISMADNNTTAFNCRAMTDFANQYSIHSYGRAIDINPLINPYIKGDKIEPKEGAAHVDRAVYHKGKITSNSIICKIFEKYGWVWGGTFSKVKDYQHFEKPLGK